MMIIDRNCTYGEILNFPGGSYSRLLLVCHCDYLPSHYRSVVVLTQSNTATEDDVVEIG